MSIVVWFNCDQGVPDGTCGEKTYAWTDTVPAAVETVSAAGWYVGVAQDSGHRRVLCPFHGSGGRQR